MRDPNKPPFLMSGLGSRPQKMSFDATDISNAVLAQSNQSNVVAPKVVEKRPTNSMPNEFNSSIKPSRNRRSAPHLFENTQQVRQRAKLEMSVPSPGSQPSWGMQQVPSAPRPPVAAPVAAPAPFTNRVDQPGNDWLWRNPTPTQAVPRTEPLPNWDIPPNTNVSIPDNMGIETSPFNDYGNFQSQNKIEEEIEIDAMLHGPPPVPKRSTGRVWYTENKPQTATRTQGFSNTIDPANLSWPEYQEYYSGTQWEPWQLYGKWRQDRLARGLGVNTR